MRILPPGTTVGKYPIVRVLSTGGMGVLYEAVHPVLGSRVVVKAVRPELAGQQSVADRFRNEALAASRVRDDRLPRIFDVDRLPDGSPYMVMEYLEGEDLAARLAGGPLPPAYAARVMIEVLEVLDRVHRLGIVHRDIKPQNIFLACSDVLGEVPKLLDFGVAHFAGGAGTRPGELTGTPMYMAVEQGTAGGEVGPWTDVFAAGVVLYECLAGGGQRPWTARDPIAYLQRLAEGAPPRPLREAAPHVEPGLADAVMRAVRIRPEERHPDAAAFADALEPFALGRAALFGARQGRERHATPTPAVRPLSPRRSGRGPATPPLGRVDGHRALDDVRRQLAGLRSRAGDAPPEGRLRPGERRHVTVVTLELRLEAAPGTPLGADELDGLLAQVVPVFADRLTEAGGHVDRLPGATVLAAFGRERTHEDDAERAVHGALALERDRETVAAALATVGVDVMTRTGIHTGFVIRADAPDGAGALDGETVSVARALAAAAPRNGTLASRETIDPLGRRYIVRAQGEAPLAARARPVTVYEVLRLGEDDPEAWTRTASSVPLVGRTGELARLLAFVEQTPAAGGALPRVGVVAGAAGIGKTRVLQELVQRLPPDVTVIRVEPPALRPFGLWGALLRRLLDDEGGDPPETALPALADALEPARRTELLAQSPVVAVLLGAATEDRIDARGMELRDRVRLSLTLALEAAARRASADGGHKLLILLDNLQRADRASLELLAPVLDGLRAPTPPLVLLGARDHDLPAFPDALRAERFRLGPLADEEVAALLEGLTGAAAPGASLLQFVRDRAAGNPLVVEQLALSLLERGLAHAPESQLRELGLPTTLYGLILSRVDRLEPVSREALRCASVLGGRFTERLFFAVTARLAGTALADATTARAHLDQLRRLGALVLEAGEGEAVYRFRQNLVRDAVYATVLSENRRLLHRLAAVAMERLYPARKGVLAAELLQHYAQTDDHERIAHYAHLVGRQACAVGAFAEAVDALSTAAALRARVPASERLVTARTLVLLGYALHQCSRLDEAGEQLGAAVAVLEGAADDDPREARRLLGRALLVRGEVLYHRGRWDASDADLVRAAAVLESAGLHAEAALVRSRRGFQLRDRGRLEEGLRHARAGWAVLRGTDDLAAIARAGHDLGNLLRDVGEHDEAVVVFGCAIEAGDRLYARGERGDVHYGRLGARSGRAMTWAAMGRFEEAIADQQAALDFARELGHGMAEAAILYHLATHRVGRDGPADRDEARALALRSLELCRERGVPVRAMKCRVLLAQIARRAGHPEEELEHLEAAEFLARESRVEPGTWVATVERIHELLVARGERTRAGAVAVAARGRLDEAAAPELAARLDALRPR